MDVHRRANRTLTRVSPAPAALALQNIAKSFGRVRALDGAGLTVRAGTIHALLGENGAGKTTLMRVAFGLVQPDTGTIERDGRPVRFANPAAAVADRIGMVHQHFSLVPSMSVADNVALGERGWYDPRRVAARVREIARMTGLALDPHATVAALPAPAQQRVEIAKAVGRGASLLILDEPTAVLAPAQSAELIAWLRAFADGGGAVVLITHRLREALTAADDITVLRHGRTALTGSAGAVSESELVEAMVGVQSPVVSGGRGHAVGAAVLALTNVSVVDAAGTARLRDATVRVCAGEIVGVAGVEGSGHRELLRVCAGRLHPTTGSAVRPAEVGFVPEDRHQDALVLEFTLVENLALAGAGRRRGRMPWAALRAETAQVLADYDVRAPGPDAPASALSGGNQQRFVLARELRTGTRALVVENPCRGLDVRAAADVHERLRAARDGGAAVLVYSSDLDELAALADRVVVCHAGTARDVEASPAAIGRALVGVPGS